MCTGDGRSSSDPSGADIYRRVVEAVEDYALFALDREGRITTWNTGAERVYGYAAADVLGHRYELLFPDEDRASRSAEELLERVRVLGRVAGAAWTVRKGGERFWAGFTITSLRTAGGEVEGFVNVVADLTNRKGAEERLRQSEQRFRLLVDGVRDYAIFMLDPTGRIVSWNAGAERISGYTADEATGRDHALFYRPEDAAAGRPARTLDIATRDGRYEEEGIRVRKDGSPFWANILITPVFAPDGNLLGFAEVSRDITARKRMTEQMLQSERLAVVGQLAAGMAHEINNPLTAVAGFAQAAERDLARPEPPLPRIREAVSHILEATWHIRAVVEDARRLSAASDVIGVADVNAALESAVRLASHEARGRATVVWDLGPRCLSRGNEGRLVQIFLNLVVNAAHAIPEGDELRQTITLRSRRDGDQVVVHVEDTGTGIPPEHLPRIFEPFFTTRAAQQGTGLGLSVARSLLTAIGGRISVDSTPGVGTRFTVQLVAEDAPEASPASPTARLPQGRRILLIEDEPLVAKSVRFLLEPDHDVTILTSAERALGLLRAGERFDVIVCDVEMPSMSGIEFYDRLPAIDPRLQARVLFVTGTAWKRQYRDFLDRQGRWLSKPASREELLAAISERLP